MFAGRTDWKLTANPLAEALERARAQKQKILDLTASNPTECGFIYDTRAIMRALCSPETLRYYPDPRGVKPAREAVRRYYEERGLNVPIDELFLTTSTSEAYSFIFRLLCDPGDELLAPVPSYPLFDYLAGLQDVKLKPYPLLYDHGWNIDFHSLEQQISSRTRGVLVVNPNNPTGHYVSREEMRRLSELCRARGMAVIADEVFLDFTVDSAQRASFAGNPEALTFTLSGLSKISGMPQMKVAWLAVSGPEELKRLAIARLEVIGDAYLSMNGPVQHAIPVLLAQRQDFQKQLMARVRQNLDELDRQLAMQRQVSRLEVEGGWYAVLRVPATRSDEDLAIALVKHAGVYVHPGHFYDFPRDGYLVISLITPGDIFRDGMSGLVRFLAGSAQAAD